MRVCLRVNPKQFSVLPPHHHFVGFHCIGMRLLHRSSRESPAVPQCPISFHTDSSGVHPLHHDSLACRSVPSHTNTMHVITPTTENHCAHLRIRSRIGLACEARLHFLPKTSMLNLGVVGSLLKVEFLTLWWQVQKHITGIGVGCCVHMLARPCCHSVRRECVAACPHSPSTLRAFTNALVNNDDHCSHLHLSEFELGVGDKILEQC